MHPLVRLCGARVAVGRPGAGRWQPVRWQVLQQGRPVRCGSGNYCPEKRMLGYIVSIFGRFVWFSEL